MSSSVASNHAKPMLLASLVALLLAALDGTAVGTLIPTILQEFGAHPLYPWLLSGFIVAQTVVTPIYGKLADVFDLRRMFLVAISLFITGSVVVALGGSFQVLLIGRLLQGIGAGGIPVLCYATVALLSKPDERMKRQSAVSSIWGVAAILGPAAGALCAKTVGWRWIFWINVPLGFVIFAIVARYFPRVRTLAGRDLNWTALAWFTVALSAFLAAVLAPGAGSSGVTVAVLVAVSVVSAGLLSLSLRKSQKSFVIHAKLVRKPALRNSLVANLGAGVLMYGAMTFVPQFLETVQERSAQIAGLAVALGALGWVVGAIICGQIEKHMDGMTSAQIGAVLMTLGAAALASLWPKAPLAMALVGQASIGFGMGFLATTTLVRVQNDVEPDEIASATSAVQLLRSVGAALGINVLATFQLTVSLQAGMLGLLPAAALTLYAVLRLPRPAPTQFPT